MDLGEHLFPLLSDLVLRTDPDGVISHAYGNLASFGYTARELIGSPLFSFIRDDSREAFLRSRTMPTLVSFKARKRGADVFADEYVPATARSNPDGAVAAFLNMQRQLELESLVERSRDQLFEQEKMASIGQLAAGVAHEINNPLGFVSNNVAILPTYILPIKVILSAVQALIAAQDEDSAAIVGRARTIAALAEEHDIGFVLSDLEDLSRESLQGLDRIKEIVMGLRHYARKDIGEKADADLNTVLDAALGIVRTKIKYHCQLVKEYAEPMPLCELNVQQITQVFINLIVNGADAIAGQGTIAVRTSVQDGMVWAEVQDTGTGIPVEIRGRIFEPLFTTKEPGKGTGLGLSITAEIVRKHHGKLLLESEVGVGTTFKVGLPLKQPA